MPAFVVSAAEAGRSVLELLRARMNISWAQARRLLADRRVRLAGKPCSDPGRRLQRGHRVEVQAGKRPAKVAAGKRAVGGAQPIICHADAHIVVVDKPAGITTMRHPGEAAEFGARARRYLPPTLADLLPGLLGRSRPGKPGRVRAVHRLDKETSGLVVFARTREAESNLGKQFRAHATERRYLALVRGRAKDGRFESMLVNDRGDGRRGSTQAQGEGKRAVTHVRVVEELGDYTLVECRLETGRTHQVRIHLAEQGTPLCGETIYDRPLHGKPVADHSGASRPALHAASLGFHHPATGKWQTWTSGLPEDLQHLLRRLRSFTS
jgi:23S rRNA pseudouridine1911/1915/1917 synthase